MRESFSPDVDNAFELLRSWVDDPEAAEGQAARLIREVGGLDLVREFLLLTGLMLGAEASETGVSELQTLGEWRRRLDM